MSTSGILGIKVGGVYKATYNHSDSYPENLGTMVVSFCRKLNRTGQWDRFKEKMMQVVLVKENDVPSQELQERYTKSGYFNDHVSTGSPTEWYCLLKNLQDGIILQEIFRGACQHMIDSFEFLTNSLYCEYAYIINLDDMTLELYKGRNTTPDENSPLPFEQKKDEDGYYPVRLVKSYKLSAIPFSIGAKRWITRFYY